MGSFAGTDSKTCLITVNRVIYYLKSTMVSFTHTSISSALSFVQVLEACMKNCGRRFHNEVGKYRFLNELIKLVSPKVRPFYLLFGGLADYFIQKDL
jgi:hypothetical protein